MSGFAVSLRSCGVHWMQRLGGNYSASPLFADGRIYFLSEEGTATVIAPGPQLNVLARNTLDGGTLASIAVSNGSLFIRSDTDQRTPTFLGIAGAGIQTRDKINGQKST